MKRVLVAIIIFSFALGGVIFMTQSQEATRKAQKEHAEAVASASALAKHEAELHDVTWLKTQAGDLITQHFKVSEYADILYDHPENQLGYLDAVEVNPLEQGNFEIELHFHNLSTTITKDGIKKATEEALKIVCGKFGDKLSSGEVGIPTIDRAKAIVNTFQGKEAYEVIVNEDELS